MWAILGMYAVQKTIDNSNENCLDCEEVPDLEVVYTTGRNVSPVFESFDKNILLKVLICYPSLNIFSIYRTAPLLLILQMLETFHQLP